MKIIVFSDSHSDTRKMREALKIHKSNTEVVVFLGDGLRDVESLKVMYPNIAFFSVKGNCDFFEREAEEERLLTLDGVKILITHGHLYGVKGGYGKIATHAEKIGADAVFFGHTHIPLESICEVNNKNIVLFNPGSIGKDGNYGVVNTSGKVIVTSCGKIL